MHSKSQRIAAIIGVVLLLLLYVINFLIGIFSSADTFSLYLASLLATFFIPVMLYCYTRILKMREKSKEQDNEDDEEQT